MSCFGVVGEVRFGGRDDVFVVVVVIPGPRINLFLMGDNGAAAAAAAATVLPWLRLLPLEDAGVALATADARNLVIFCGAAGWWVNPTTLINGK